MKLRLILVAVLFSVLSVFTTSCSDDEDKCKDVKCEAYQVCNENNGECVVKDANCEEDNDCTAAQFCDRSVHKCAPKQCKEKCVDEHGLAQGTCSVVDNEPSCECAEGYMASPKNKYCHKIPETCKGESACGGFGDCEAKDNIDTPFECVCDPGYVISADGSTCEATTYCSNSNTTADCEKSCEECTNTGDETTPNWECVLPAGARACDGAFNDQCDPIVGGWWENPECGDQMLCEGEDKESGYCTHITCKLDADCIETYGDKFVCKNFSDDQYSYGICVKLGDSCFKEDGSRKGGGADGDRCGETCQDADCNEGLICNKGVCSRTCSGSDDDTCLDPLNGKRSCTIISPLYNNVNSYFCSLTGSDLGDDCSDISCNAGLRCLELNDGTSSCFQLCDLNNDKCLSLVGTGSECRDIGIGVCSPPDAPKTQELGEVCGAYKADCVDGLYCLGYPGEDSHCMAACTTASDASAECDGNERCIALDGDVDGDGNNDFYCNPNVVPTQNPGEECILGELACVDDGWCLTDNTCYAKCTAESDASDECGGESCNPVSDGNGGVVGYFCNIPSTKTKSLGEACSPINDCLDGLVCLNHPDADSGYCYDECNPAGDGSDCAAETECTLYSQTAAFCMPECMADTDCSIDNMCNPETAKCEAPVACETNGCDTLFESTCANNGAVSTCVYDAKDKCLALENTICGGETPECIEASQQAACYATQVVTCTAEGNECVANILNTSCVNDVCVAPID